MTDYIDLDLLESIINNFISQNKMLHDELNIQKQEFCISVSEKGRKTNYQFKTNGLIEIEKYHDYYNYEWENCKLLDLLLSKLIENQYVIEYNDKYWFLNERYTNPQIWAWINILKEENIMLQNELNELKKGLRRL